MNNTYDKIIFLIFSIRIVFRYTKGNPRQQHAKNMENPSNLLEVGEAAKYLATLCFLTRLSLKAFLRQYCIKVIIHLIEVLLFCLIKFNITFTMGIKYRVEIFLLHQSNGFN